MMNNQTITKPNNHSNAAQYPGTMGELHEQLIEAAQQGDTQTIVRLLAQTPDLRHYVDVRSGSPLHHAAACNQFATVRLLLLRGFSPDAPDELGMTPLHLAAMRDLRIVRMLLCVGANATCYSGNGYTPLDIARMMGQSDITCAIEEHLREKAARETLAHQQAARPLWLRYLRDCFCLD